MPSPLAWRRLALAGGVAAVLAVVAAVPAWRAAFGWFERSGRLATLVERQPEKFRIHWSSLRSPWPGWIEVHDLRVAGRTPRLRWQVSADRVSGQLFPAALIRRELRFDRVRASGLRVRSARFEPPAPIDPAAAPPIDALPASPGPGPRADRPAWTYRFTDVAFEGLSELWVDDRRATGTASGRGGFAVRRRMFAEVEPTLVELEGVRIEVAGRPVASGLAGRGSFRIAPWRYSRAPVSRVARGFTGRIELRGDCDPNGIVAYLYRGWDWLDLRGSPARFEARIHAADGAYLRGSHLLATQPEQRVSFFGFEARGDARLEARVTGSPRQPILESRLEFGRWALGRPGAPAPLTGEGLRLEAHAARPRLDEPPQAVDLSLDLGTARARDLGFLQAFVPAAARTTVLGGSATLGGRLEFATADLKGGGTVRIDARGVDLDVAGERISGDLSADLKLGDPDFESPVSFSLAGSEVRLDRFGAAASNGDRVAGWWSELRLSSGRLEFADPLRLGFDFDARLRDTRPLVFAWQLRRDLPAWAERLLTVEGLSAGGHLDWTRGRLRLADGRVPLANGEIRGEADLENGRRSSRLLLSWRRLAVGVEIEGERRDLRLLGAREWFENETGLRTERIRSPGED